MSSYAKTKVLALTLVIALLALQSVANWHHMEIVDCGPNEWRLFNGVVNWTDNGLDLFANIALGLNSTIMQSIDVHFPFCLHSFPCRDNNNTSNLVREFCNHPNLSSLANRSCSFIKNLPDLPMPFLHLPYCQDILSCWKDNLRISVRNESCGTPDLDPITASTCSVLKNMASSERLIDQIRQHFNATDEDLCWEYTTTSIEIGQDSSDWSSDVDSSVDSSI